MAVDLDPLARRFALGAAEFTTSPLYRRLCTLVAQDPALLAIAAHCRAGQQPTNLFLAAAHFLVLGGTAPQLGAYYASVAGSGARAAEDVAPVFRAFCLDHQDELVELVSTRLVQTNVVKRSAALWLGMAAVAATYDGPVTLLELGCSAGILLCFDRYHYAAAGATWGEPASPVAISFAWRATQPAATMQRIPRVVERVGIDLNPVNPTDTTERRWLRALVWPENAHEVKLLDTALGVVAADPPRMLRGDALELLPQLGEELSRDRPVVVFHAATRAHVPAALRARFDETIAALGEQRPLYWLSNEGPILPDDRVPRLPMHVLALRTRHRGESTARHLALIEGHAEWIQPLDL